VIGCPVTVDQSQAARPETTGIVGARHSATSPVRVTITGSDFRSRPDFLVTFDGEHFALILGPLGPK